MVVAEKSIRDLRTAMNTVNRVMREELDNVTGRQYFNMVNFVVAIDELIDVFTQNRANELEKEVEKENGETNDNN